jgi:hypothetical protein
MTRAISITADHFVIGLSNFGTRQQRGHLGCPVAIFDQQLTPLNGFVLSGSPVDIFVI